MSVTLADIARLIGASVSSNAGLVEITGVNSLENADLNELSFLSNPKYARQLKTTNAAAVILAKETELPEATVALIVDDPYFATLKVIELFNTRRPSDIAEGLDKSARIHPDAKLGSDVSVGANAVIGPGVDIGDRTVVGPCTVILNDCSIGSNCLLYPNVTIMDGCEIGNNVIIHSGTVIGADGFGFAPHKGALHKIPQLGGVKIEDNVEIQSNTCVDRAALGMTVIGKGSKVDNLVQIGHNSIIGQSSVVVSQAGISGSTVVGNGVKIGGQAGFAGHMHIGDGASVGAQAGVTKDVPAGEIVSGYPARKHSEELRVEAALRKLPETTRKVKAQEKRIAELERLIEKLSDSKNLK